MTGAAICEADGSARTRWSGTRVLAIVGAGVACGAYAAVTLTTMVEPLPQDDVTILFVVVLAVLPLVALGVGWAVLASSVRVARGRRLIAAGAVTVVVLAALCAVRAGTRAELVAHGPEMTAVADHLRAESSRSGGSVDQVSTIGWLPSYGDGLVPCGAPELGVVFELSSSDHFFAGPELLYCPDGPGQVAGMNADALTQGWYLLEHD